MRAIALCSVGLESVVLLDLKEILGVVGKIHSAGRVIYDASADDIARFTYFSRSILGSYLLLGSCAPTLAALSAAVTSLSVPYFPAPFRVRCLHQGVAFSSLDVEKLLGEVLQTRYACPVALADPSVIFFVDVALDICLFGIDFAGVPLQKREWRVKTLSSSLPACLAYGVVRLSGYCGTGTLLDPFVGDGAILIEASLFSAGVASALRFEKDLACTRLVTLPSSRARKSPRGSCIGFDPQLGHVRATQVNAKLAGISLDLGRCPVADLDLKLPPCSVDFVVTHPVVHKAFVTAADFSATLSSLFVVLADVLKKTGTVCLILDVAHLSVPPTFVCTRQHQVIVGQRTFYLLFFSKA